jgi:D,D-heptose 1,7-bisphosphate phosphatase
MRKAVFLDRDNTLIKDEGYFHDPDKIELMPGIEDALQNLQDAGYLLVGITNQSGIGRGYFPESDAIAVHAKLIRILGSRGIELKKIYYCPHAPEDNCICRKPKPFLILKAAEELDIDLGKSYFIGDHLVDMEAGRAAGTKTILLSPREGSTSEKIDFSAPSGDAAAQWILSNEKLHLYI